MKSLIQKLIILLCVFTLVLPALPLETATAQAAIAHPFEQSVLLMASSHMRLNGDVLSVQLDSGHLLAPAAQQIVIDNEVDILINLYKARITALRQGSDYSPELEAKLISELEEKVAALEKDKGTLVQVRQRRHRRGFFRKLARGAGRFFGTLVGGAMEGAGKIVQFGIEEVAPRVLKEAIRSGNPITGALVRSVVKELLLKRVEKAVMRELEKRAERLENRRANGESLDDEGIDLADSMETQAVIEETQFAIQKTQSAIQQPTEGNSGEQPADPGAQSSGNLVVYDFTAEDAFNFDSDWGVGSLGWNTMGDSSGADWCYPNSGGIVDSATGHLEFNLDTMTVSGWIEESVQNTTYQENYTSSDVQGSFRVTFSDLAMYTESGPGYEGYSWQFKGEGIVNASFSGQVLCKDYGTSTEPDNYYMISDQTSLSSATISVNGILFKPGFVTSVGDPLTLNLFGGLPEENTLHITYSFSFSDPLAVPLPPED